MRLSVQRHAIQGPLPRTSILLLIDGKPCGEAAPLPGRSRETIEQAEEELIHFISDPDPTHLLSPSVQFALTSALHLALHSPPPPTYKTHLLLMGNRDEILERAAKGWKNGHRVAKLKLAKLTLEDAHLLIEQLSPFFKLRLDCNQRFTLVEAVDFFSRYSPSMFDYIEEPLQHPADLVHFPFPFALDESLQDPSLFPLASHSNCVCLILKPTLLGELSRYLKMHPRCLLSHCFEGPVGLSAVAQLVQTHSLEDAFHGLDSLSD